MVVAVGVKVKAPKDEKAVVLSGRAVALLYNGVLGSGLFPVPDE